MPETKTILDDVTLTKAGKPVEGDPQPGLYYLARPKQDGADVGAIAKALRKAYPKSSFTVAP